MRVRHLSGHEEFELWAIWYHLITKLNVRSTTEFDDILLQDWLQGWIESLLDVLKQDRVTQSDGCIADIEELWIGQLDDLQVILLLHVLDPLIALTLRIDNEWPSLCRCCDDAIVY